MALRPVIRSMRNPALLRAREVLAGRDRRAIALEGDRLIDDARAAGLRFELVLVASDREERARELESFGLEVERVDGELLARASKLSTSPGAIAIAAAPPAHPLSRIAADSSAVVLGIAGVADPGNLGALARSAEASGASALIVAGGGAHPWSEKALRGSMGSLLRVPVHLVRDAAEAQRELQTRGFRGVRAQTRGGTDFERFDWRGPIVLWFGSETGEVPRGLEELERVSIPMRGAVESLNVAVAASLLLFRAARSREATR